LQTQGGAARARVGSVLNLLGTRAHEPTRHAGPMSMGQTFGGRDSDDVLWLWSIDPEAKSQTETSSRPQTARR